MFKRYLQIIKPGIIFGNLSSMIGGFIFATKGQIDYILFLLTIISLSMIVASSSILNNYIDKDIDSRMQRTKNRIIISNLNYLIIALVLGYIGFFLLLFYINKLTFLLGVLGFIVYVFVYSLYLNTNAIIR